jgi:nucleotide-binding universal stress UspA family protein
MNSAKVGAFVQMALDTPAPRGSSISPTRIIVGIDGSPSSQAALSWAAKIARATRWSLRAVHVLEWPVGLTALDAPAEVLVLRDADVDLSYRRGMRRVFHEVHPPPEWTLTFSTGRPADILVRMAQEAELLVIGSREHSASGRTLAGGISHYCISQTIVPVVIVPVEYLGDT